MKIFDEKCWWVDEKDWWKGWWKRLMKKDNEKVGERSQWKRLKKIAFLKNVNERGRDEKGQWKCWWKRLMRKLEKGWCKRLMENEKENGRWKCLMKNVDENVW